MKKLLAIPVLLLTLAVVSPVDLAHAAIPSNAPICGSSGCIGYPYVTKIVLSDSTLSAKVVPFEPLYNNSGQVSNRGFVFAAVRVFFDRLGEHYVPTTLILSRGHTVIASFDITGDSLICYPSCPTVSPDS